MKKTVSQYINGINTSSHSTIKILYSPATGEEIGQIAYVSEDELNQAIQSSQDAFLGWSSLSIQQRLEILKNFEYSIENNKNELAKKIMAEEGKSFSAAQVDIQLLLNHLYSVLNQSNDMNGVPIGLSVFLGEPEFPALTCFCLVPIALALGNVCLVKASHTSPSAVMMLANMLTEVGLPKGVLNVIQGDDLVSAYLIQASGVDAITSVSTASVFLKHMQLAKQHSKKIQHIMRPWSLSVIMSDADLACAVEEIVQSMFMLPKSFSASVSILNTSIILAEKKIADKILPKLKVRMSQFKLGPAQENEITIGPLSSEQHLYQMRNCINTAVSEGAKVILDGRHTYVRGYESGYFMGSSLLDNVTSNMSVFKEDLTAPILSVHRVSDLEEAKALMCKIGMQSITESVDSIRALQTTCAIYSRDLNNAFEFAESVPATLVAINGKTTSHYLAHSDGRAVVMDVTLANTILFCRDFFKG